MNAFEQIKPESFDRIFDRIGKQWMLISAADGKHKNAMTASWGGCGILWNKPVAICYIRPQRFTYSIVENSTHLSLSFLSEDYRSALSFCGKASGRDCDKFKESGLTVSQFEGVPYPSEAEFVLICRKLYADDIKEDRFLDPSLLSNYPKKDYHRFYVCEIEQVLAREKA